MAPRTPHSEKNNNLDTDQYLSPQQCNKAPNAKTTTIRDIKHANNTKTEFQENSKLGNANPNIKYTYDSIIEATATTVSLNSEGDTKVLPYTNNDTMPEIPTLSHNPYTNKEIK